MSKKNNEAKIFWKARNIPDMTYYVNGVGIYETMQPGIVNRPTGSKDWLLMYFHDSVFVKTSQGVNKFPAGSLIIWSDTDGHYYGNPEIEWKHSWIHSHNKTIASMIEDVGLKINTVMTLNSPDILIESLSRIYHEMSEQVEPDMVVLQNFYQNMLHMLGRQICQGEKREIIPQRILRIKKLIESCPSKKYTLTVLAKEASMSVPHFCSEFKKYVLVSPIEYLIRMRLQQAKYLLCDFNLSIAEIADRLGYHDIFHFSKQFKKYFGVSPMGMRRSYTEL